MACLWDGVYLDGLNSSEFVVPSEIQVVFENGSNNEFLDSLAILALDTKWTARILVAYEPLMVDICNRWLHGHLPAADRLSIIAALASIMPFASHLSPYTAEAVFGQDSFDAVSMSFSQETEIGNNSESRLLRYLLALTRLVEYDNTTYAPVLRPSKMQELLSHENRSIRYLATKLLCLYLHASDKIFTEMKHRFLGDIEALGPWDDRTINYLFYPVWEARRQRYIRDSLLRKRAARLAPPPSSQGLRLLEQKDFSKSTIAIASLLVPHVGAVAEELFNLVMTDGTSHSIRLLISSIISSQPTLVAGPPGSGKTSIIKEIARVLCQDSKMLTLHLNEQTDAKHLIGLYSMSGMNRSFSWQPGVLTRAVQEGRWVLIEDIDHAPNDVISLLLPLIERNELFVPNLGGYVRANRGFKLLATVRTTQISSSKASLLGQGLLQTDSWYLVSLQPLGDPDIQKIIATKYPILSDYQPMIMGLFHSFESLGSKSSDGRTVKEHLRVAQGSVSLFRFCRRMEALLEGAGIQSSTDPISEAVLDSIFLEAVDSFASGIHSDESRWEVVQVIARHLQISPTRTRYCFITRVPDCVDRSTNYRVGRVTLQKRHISQASRPLAQTRLFVRTKYALRSCESIAAAIRMREPCLLIGETGTGKTTLVQELATSLGYTLTVVNLSQQSEASDLMGGFKPLNVRALAVPLKDDFAPLFNETFPSDQNQRFVAALSQAILRKEWSRLAKLLRGVLRRVDDALESRRNNREPSIEIEPPKKRKKTIHKLDSLAERWENLSQQLHVFEKSIEISSKGFAFSFREGNIVKAVRDGNWVLLDEINLASSDVLESLSDLLSHDADGPFLLLSETGKIEKIKAHPNFRIFGAMNPASDVGKKDLPPAIRFQFTELFIDSPDKDVESLTQIAGSYLGSLLHSDKCVGQDVANLFMDIKLLEKDNRLADGAGQKPHFSLRTLTRTMMYAKDVAHIYGLRRALFEGFTLTFLTVLNAESKNLVLPFIRQRLFGVKDNKALRLQTPRSPNDGGHYVQFKHHWVLKGPLEVLNQPDYILTPFVEENLLNLVRATSTRKYPVLLQGPTSSGKTSMVEYLARVSGNYCVRINNHEHTDLQEYLGTYVSETNGQIVYREGVLVRALREGHWIVLDELNLASSDILEALNRLLDDNRELLIPETQELVRPHRNFMLFATQNPPGLYGGRKVLSRAFRNRFLEIHFDDIPDQELETILRERTKIAPSFCSRIVSVYKKLAVLRQSDRMFEQNQSFATLRDLFRWADRKAESREELAIHGFMILGERVRNPDERLAVKHIIEEVMKTTVDPDKLYDVSKFLQMPTALVWTESLCRLFVLITEALKRNEPVLLVGDTGTGKTAVCQAIAHSMGARLHILNAHQNTETGDLVGSQRPIRNRSQLDEAIQKDLEQLFIHILPDSQAVSQHPSLIDAYQSLSQASLDLISLETRQSLGERILRTKALFEWSDSNLVQAMLNGDHFLLDEISLADDAVLERLNSVLEPSRILFLAEKGGGSAVTASRGFQFLATMNPPGDYGKRELSPALRNRFTEIWVPSMAVDQDVRKIVGAKLSPVLAKFADSIVAFSTWFNETYNESLSSLRQILTWVEFANSSILADPYLSIVQGAAMVFIDGLGASPSGKLTARQTSPSAERQRCLSKLSQLLEHDLTGLYFEKQSLAVGKESVSIGPFQLARNSQVPSDTSFNLNAPTTFANALRIARALHLGKPVLIEGNPGVGKTTLVAALAQIVGAPLTRINLSEQTDIMDLFGSDVPAENSTAGHFVWRDAPFLQAMQRGEWVLLDEMNLASQTVLEGLNACLDHRGQVYIPELDQAFSRHPSFMVFAAQNPHSQGNGRKGLPASFVNRFTVVHADILTDEDLTLICRQLYPNLPKSAVDLLIGFVQELNKQVSKLQSVLNNVGFVDYNMRDLLRWLQLVTVGSSAPINENATHFVDLIFLHRLRADQELVRDLRVKGQQYLDPQQQVSHDSSIHLSPSIFQVGHAFVERSGMQSKCDIVRLGNRPGTYSLALLESLTFAVQHKWPCLLVGQRGLGNFAMLQGLACQTGAFLMELPMNSDMDTMDLIGGYEQTDISRTVFDFIDKVRTISGQLLTKLLVSVPGATSIGPIMAISEYCSLSGSKDLALLRSLLTDAEKTSSFYGICNALTKECIRLLKEQDKVSQAHFEWVDGVLVKALQEGHWLVLRDANLCNSSVLDRLNALMEPAGTLALTEHHLPDGSHRIVQPHENFRLFLTMDPKYGELSRAMRNRCVELFFPLQEAASESPNLTFSESSLVRYTFFQSIDWNTVDTALIRDVSLFCLDHLSIQDLKLYEQFCTQASFGLIDLKPPKLNLFLDSCAIWSEFISQNDSVCCAIKELYQTVIWQSPNSEELVDAQPIHPLNNVALISSAPERSKKAAWIADLLDTAVNLSRIRHDIEGSTGSLARDINASSFLLRTRNLRTSASRASTITYAVEIFIKQFVNGLQQWLTSSASTQRYDLGSLAQIQGAMDFLEDLFCLVLHGSMDEAAFQIYLEIGGSIAGKLQATPSCSHLGDAMLLTLHELQRPWTLSTGLGMTRLWKQFRPLTAASEGHLTSILELENVADRFDSIVNRLHNISRVIYDLRDTLRHTREQFMATETLPEISLENLVEPLETIERETLRSHIIRQGQFTQVFEGLCQANLDSAESMVPKLTLLEPFAQRQTLNGFGSDQSATGASVLSQIQKRTGIGRGGHELMLQRNVIPISMMVGLRTMSYVSLQRLEYLQQELKLLQESLRGLCLMSNADPFDPLLRLLGELHKCVLGSYQDILDPNWFTNCLMYLEDYPANVRHAPHRPQSPEVSVRGRSSFDTNTSSHALQSFNDHIFPSLQMLHNVAVESPVNRTAFAQAWITFFVGCLCLYLPDRIYDPAKREIVLQYRFKLKKQRLQNKMDAVGIFDAAQAAGNSSLRYQQAKRALADLGDVPKLGNIFRPETSRLGDLQGEFSSILTSVVNSAKALLDPTNLEKKQPVTRSEIFLLRQNVNRSISRLCSNYRPYDDLSRPVVGFLQGLDVGLTLSLLQDTPDLHKQKATTTILQLTPLLGLTPSSISDFPIFKMRGSHGTTLDNRKLSLHFASLALNIDRQASHKLRRTMFEALHSYYDDWKRQLHSDIDKHNARTSLYQYRGLKEDNDAIDPQEYPEWFPELEFSQPVEVTPGTEASDLGVISPQEVATLHEKLFIHKQKPSDMILAIIRSSSDAITALWQDTNDLAVIPVARSVLLCGMILGLDQVSEEIAYNPVKSPTYNFYTDKNIQEGQKLLQLVRRIHVKFRDIYSVWPDHATLAEVLRVSNELMEFSFCETVAKLLTKAEQLHAFVYEWQSVASREYTAVAVYEELTALLVSWRQLELSTWAGLLDSEDRKCQSDAQSWWFLAYEVTVAVPLEVVESNGDLKLHTHGLTKSLVEFLANTPLGQYQQRLEILARLGDFVQLLMIEHLSMHLVYTALTNTLRYYTRFLLGIQETLKKGRLGLEKDVRDVIQLATWKDTNISALRESSRRSRTKLLKIVRKYRALLSQPVAALLSHGPSDDNNNLCEFRPNLSPGNFPLLPKALHICAENLVSWVRKPARFTQVHATAEQVAHMSMFPLTAINADAHVHTFIADLTESVRSLRNETPSEATGEGISMVKHLKSRKRRLLADTLQKLRFMGFKSNPGLQLLERQASLHSILADSPSLSNLVFDTGYTEHCFDRSLDVLSSIRSNATSRSEDLTSKEASRCLGNLEGILSMILDQRRLLAFTLGNISKLDGVLKSMSGLWHYDFECLQQSENSITSSQMRSRGSWLVHLIEAVCRIIQKHDQMTAADNSMLVDALHQWKETFNAVITSPIHSLSLPKGLTTEHHARFENKMLQTLSAFALFIGKKEVDHPTMAFILKKLRLWATESLASPTPNNHASSVELPLLDERLSNLIDSVLASIERVQESLSNYPASFDQPCWLAQANGTIGKCLRSLRIENYASSLESLLDIVQSVSDQGSPKLDVAAAMCTVSAPIFYQYLETSKDLVRRQLLIHQACCSMLYRLSAIYKQIATDGFCSPRGKAQDSDERAQKLEDGTGLGEGVGAEDISKDVEDDEDLSELAAQKATKEDEHDEMQAQDDAIDMDHDELEGEVSDASNDKSEDDQDASDEGENAEIDEETGSVDDLDPSAVDERLWDEVGSRNKGERENDKCRGEKQDEMTSKDGAGEDNDQDSRSNPEDEEDPDASEDVQVEHQSPEPLDPHANQEDHLDLPDEMEIDGKDKPLTDSESDSAGDLSDADQSQTSPQEGDREVDDDEVPETSQAGDKDTEKLGIEDAEVSEEISEDDGEKDVEEGQDKLIQTNGEQQGQHDAFGGETQEGPTGVDKQNELNEEQGWGTNEQVGDNKELETGEQAEDSAQNGQHGRGEGQFQHNSQKMESNNIEDRLERAFKKLGDALETWHRQNRPLESAQDSEQDRDMNVDMDPATELFEHVPDENAVSDAQALGAATDEEAHALDEKAMEAEISGDQVDFPPDDATSSERNDVNDQMEGIEEVHQTNLTEQSSIIKPASAFINGYQSNQSNHQGSKVAEDESDVSALDTNLSVVHLHQPSDSSLSRSNAEARQLWAHYEAQTHNLSLILTEQLRLILAPTLATRMRGDFRTGKRLNIKRIIPYIASGYKRDKIWMRRSVPSKRSYHIMFAVDDSKSMGSGGSAALAFETLALVSKSLSMLEVGQICIIGFGDEVRVAHEFEQTFSSDAGANVLQHFGFQQTRTNVKSLMVESIKLFREARAKALHSATDLWQLEMIISDGVCEDHEGIRRLVRQAHDERIMVVFVIVDGVKGESIMDMTRAEFEDDGGEGGSKVKIRRYLEGFPFGYYLIVGDVKELPGVLATALRQWFTEVAESS